MQMAAGCLVRYNVFVSLIRVYLGDTMFLLLPLKCSIAIIQIPIDFIPVLNILCNMGVGYT